MSSPVNSPAPAQVHWLAELLQLDRLVEVVDIGANPIDGEPPYQAMLDAAVCRVTGFEPQQHAFEKLLQMQNAHQRYLPWVVGDGQTHEFRLCVGDGFASLLEPDPKALAVFEAFVPLGAVRGRVETPTQRLDDIQEIEHLDFLKIDIQGGELLVFQNGPEKLSRAVAIQTEVSFMKLYQDQPSQGEIDVFLRGLGFVPHMFAAIKQWPIAPAIHQGDPYRPFNQLLEADLVYVRDFSQTEKMDNTQLKNLAMIAHMAYRSYDLAILCLSQLQHRQCLPVGTVERYLSLAHKV